MDAPALSLTAIILKGGRSSRMGEDKSLLLIDGQSMIQRLYDALSEMADTVMVSLAKGETCPLPGVIDVPDIEVDKGPLMGIYSSLSASSSDLNLVVACDIPRVDVETIKQLLSFSDTYDIVVPSFQEGRVEPLFGLYRKAVASVAGQLLDEGATRVSALFDRCRTKVLSLPNTGWYRNLNTPEDYERWVRDSK